MIEELQATDGICETCGRADPVKVEVECFLYRAWPVAPPRVCVGFHPAVSFCHDHGIDLTWDIGDVHVLERFWEFNGHVGELVSVHPLRIRVTIRCERDESSQAGDEKLEVGDPSETGATSVKGPRLAV